MIRLSARHLPCSAHLSSPALHGPAERTLIELWLTDLGGLMLNGYTEAPAPARALVAAESTVSYLADHRPTPALPAARAA